MFFRLGSLDIWPHRKTLIENMPESYKKDFPNTIVIIDCTELKRHTNKLLFIDKASVILITNHVQL